MEGHDHSMMMDHHDHHSMLTSNMTAAMQADDNLFCTGQMGMVMYMDGFHWTLQQNHSCINLFFAGWTLNTRFKFFLAILGVLILAALTEGVSRLRHEVFQKARAAPLSEHQKYLLMQTGLHGLHAFMGYFLMLAAMTFSLEIFLAVLIGLVIGYVVFGGDSQAHVTTNPCCAFLEDEALLQGEPQTEYSTIPERESERRNGESCCSSDAGAPDAAMNI